MFLFLIVIDLSISIIDKECHTRIIFSIVTFFYRPLSISTG